MTQFKQLIDEVLEGEITIVAVGLRWCIFVILGT
jgi:hypothetical protein